MIVVGTTIASFAMSEPDAWSSWLKHAERQQAMAAELGHDLRHFAAIQVDARGIEPFADLCQAITNLGGEWWTYSLDDGRTKVDMTNRWRHIVVGQNLVVDYCQARPDCTHLLFLAADCAASSDIIPRMLEMDHPLVAPYITTYGLRGPVVVGGSCPDCELSVMHTDGDQIKCGACGWRSIHRSGWVDRYPFHVEDAMASAAALFIARDVFRRIRFRWDLDAQMSDDPCFHHDAKTLLGIPTYVRHDVLARHYPEAVGAYETRFDPSELEIQR